MPDIDNTLKTLFDALCAPAGIANAPTTVPRDDVFVLAIEDKQFSPVTAPADHHWHGASSEDLALISVTTKETAIDDAVALGGKSFRSLRKHVF